MFRLEKKKKKIPHHQNAARSNKKSQEIEGLVCYVVIRQRSSLCNCVSYFSYLIWIVRKQSEIKIQKYKQYILFPYQSRYPIF